MKYALIVAAGRNGVIGKDGDLPWRLPADLKHFKTVTMGKPIVMGRKTWDSIGKPLPGRRNIVLARRTDVDVPEGVDVIRDVDLLEQHLDGAGEVMIIGGESVYRLFLPIASKLYFTRVEASLEGDAYFPEWDPGEWNCVNRTRVEPDDRNAYAMEFCEYERKSMD